MSSWAAVAGGAVRKTTAETSAREVFFIIGRHTEQETKQQGAAELGCPKE
jgi:hypothetical protein